MIIINGRFLGIPQPTGTHRASRGLLKAMRPYLGDFLVYGRTALTEDELTELDLAHHYQNEKQTASAESPLGTVFIPILPALPGPVFFDGFSASFF